MKPRNFPAKIDARRRTALEQWPHKGATAERDYAATESKLMVNPRDIRTKKYRGARSGAKP